MLERDIWVYSVERADIPKLFSNVVIVVVRIVGTIITACFLLQGLLTKACTLNKKQVSVYASNSTVDSPR